MRAVVVAPLVDQNRPSRGPYQTRHRPGVARSPSCPSSAVAGCLTDQDPLGRWCLRSRYHSWPARPARRAAEHGCPPRSEVVRSTPSSRRSAAPRAPSPSAARTHWPAAPRRFGRRPRRVRSPPAAATLRRTVPMMSRGPRIAPRPRRRPHVDTARRVRRARATPARALLPAPVSASSRTLRQRWRDEILRVTHHDRGRTPLRIVRPQPPREEPPHRTRAPRDWP